MRTLVLFCDTCGHVGETPWPMERTTLRSEILPRSRCARCRQPASDMRIIWNPAANALDGSRTGKDDDT
ncbi:hypothetical protein [Citreimonas sp.]|uniref:hypothetical protein n=1 Tax=Citreimonas sp. TaxID=3036715 RepID=UPI00405869C6